MKEIVATIKKLATTVFARSIDHKHYRPAHCGNIKTLLLHLCDFDHDMCLWILRWLAYPLRNPGTKMASGIVINANAMTGKSLFFSRVAAKLHGPNGRVITTYDLLSPFTGWASGAGLVVVDGTFTERTAARIEPFISSDSLMIERPGEHACVRPNRVNFVFLSDAIDFLPESLGARRFLILEAPPARARTFYAAAIHEIDNGGIEAFREYLMRDLDIGSFNESTQPPLPRIIKQPEAA